MTALTEPGTTRLLEDELLLACMRTCLETGSLARVSHLLPQAGQWEYLLAKATRHGITSIVFHILSQLDSAEIPGNVLAQLRAATREATAQHLNQTGTLMTLLEAFKASAISAVPFKGPVLASALYGQVAVRNSVDLDVLVRREDILAAKDVMLAHGYSTDLPRDAAQRAAYLRSRNELHFTPHDGGPSVEIHQALVPPSYSVDFDFRLLWDRLVPATFCRREILALSWDDLLIALCVHAAKHSWGQLRWIMDVAKLLEVAQLKLNWNWIFETSSSIGAARMIRVTLLLASGVLGAPLPPDVMKWSIKDRHAGRLQGTVERSWFNETSTGELSTHFFFLRARERLRDKVISCFHLAFVPTEADYATVRLPAVLSVLYYPLHAVRVTGKYWRT